MGLRILKRDGQGVIKIFKRMNRSSGHMHGYLKRILKRNIGNPLDARGYLRRVLRRSEMVEDAQKTTRLHGWKTLEDIYG